MGRLRGGFGRSGVHRHTAGLSSRLLRIDGHCARDGYRLLLAMLTLATLKAHAKGLLGVASLHSNNLGFYSHQ